MQILFWAKNIIRGKKINMCISLNYGGFQIQKSTGLKGKLIEYLFCQGYHEN